MNEDEITFWNAEGALGEFVSKYPRYKIAFASIAGSHSFGWALPRRNGEVDSRFHRAQARRASTSV